MTPFQRNEPTLQLPDPDEIRAAISATDERARLLRRLLRLALKLDKTRPDRNTSEGGKP